jgi:hypothetical protein
LSEKHTQVEKGSCLRHPALVVVESHYSRHA